jgi:hypothetical protein
MPLDGSGTASRPAGTTFAPNTTIESSKMNSLSADIYDIFNAPRPITKGGTGATSASGARTNLGLDGAFAIGNLSKADGNIIVGDGTNFVAESGATARTSLGLGSGDSPQFTGIELGHETDTTLTRGAAGFLAVEGKRVPSPASQAAGDILYRGADEWERLPKGTAAQVLKMNAGATAPEWGEAAGGGIGDSQSWQDVSGSRTWSTSYQNTTGKPIEVAVRYSTGSATSMQLQVSANNSTWFDVGAASSANAQQGSAIVPNGHYYRLHNSVGTTSRSITYWSELR